MNKVQQEFAKEFIDGATALYKSDSSSTNSLQYLSLTAKPKSLAYDAFYMTTIIFG